MTTPDLAQGLRMSNAQPLIAVVDDEASVCKALGRLFAASGFSVATFTSGQKLLNSLSTCRPECVVLDLQMPGLSGVDVLRALSRAELEVPVIIITGRDEAASRAVCLAAGARAYLLKPLNQTDLLQAIGEALCTKSL